MNETYIDIKNKDVYTFIS